MEFQLPQYRHFQKSLIQVAESFSLNPDKLKVEFFTPNCQAILVEQVDNQDFKIHINLQENRIVSFRRLSQNSNGVSESLKEKYRRYMK